MSKLKLHDIDYASVGSLECYCFNSGSFYTDGGASMGVLPKTIWRKTLSVDDRNRIELATNVLLIKSREDTILVDTGLGYEHDEKTKKIYSPQTSTLLEKLSSLGVNRNQISKIVMTHLHHDHWGGLLHWANGTPEPMFPKAHIYIQKTEWETAINPDLLNEAAYRNTDSLQVLAEKGQLRLIEGSYALSPQIHLINTGGHTKGTQIVKISEKGAVAYYPGDIIPHELHMHIPVTSAYEVCREQTVKAKIEIIDHVKKTKGVIFLNHQTGGKKLIDYQTS
jgi:glyoxylase-like metal-dependent hydrolase (beta-lactamase superfamily II)